MDEYFIGSGALLTAGANGSIRGATLHAQTNVPKATQVAAAVIDFESASADELSRVLIVAAGWGSSRFQAEVVAPLLARRECALAEVIEVLARAVGTGEVHLFARWQPGEATRLLLEGRGVRIQAHPLDDIGQAALISGQRVERWRPPVRAA